MPTYQLLTNSRPDSNKQNIPSQEYRKLLDSIKSLSYSKESHRNQFLQLQNVAKAIEQQKADLIVKAQEIAAKTEQIKPVLSKRESRRLIKAESSSPIIKEENTLNLPYEKWIAVLIGAALFTQKQIKENNRITYIKVNPIVRPEGTFLTGGSSLHQSIDQLNVIVNIAQAENNVQAKNFFKRAFYDWYQETSNLVIDGEKCASVQTAFNITAKEQASSDAVRQASENILNSTFGQLPEISPAQYQAFFQEKNFDGACDYAKADTDASSGIVMGAVNIVSGTVGIATTVVNTGLSYIIPSSFWGASAKPQTNQIQNDSKKDDSVKVDTSSLVVSGNP